MTTRQEIIVGDCRAVLAGLPDKSVHCVVTSPPYLGLRDYGVAGQIGLESTVAEHIAVMVEVFREVRRVLRDDGTAWINYGDAYASSVNGRSAADTKALSGDDRTFRDKPLDTVKASGLKPKDLLMLPARLALALQDDGWFLRSDIIWHKPNPMPESPTDRPTSAHEHVFLLAKSERYFYDADAIRTPAKPSSVARLAQNVEQQQGSIRANGGTRADRPMKAVARMDKQRGHSRRHNGFNDRWDLISVAEQQAMGANARNVWTIATEPFAGEFCVSCRTYFEGQGKRRIRQQDTSGDDGESRKVRVCPCGASRWLSHFATFPTELARRCIAAGAPLRCCSVCAAPWRRQTDKSFIPQPDVSPAKRRRNGAAMDKSRRDGATERGSLAVETKGFEPTCDCVDASPAPAIVLDPFGGAGTVALVAYRTGRNAILAELNPDYADLARARLNRERERGVTGDLFESAAAKRIPSLKPEAVSVRPRRDQIDLVELIQDVDAGDRQEPAESLGKPIALKAPRKSPKPRKAAKVKKAAPLPPPLKPPRKALRPNTHAGRGR